MTSLRLRRQAVKLVASQDAELGVLLNNPAPHQGCYKNLHHQAQPVSKDVSATQGTLQIPHTGSSLEPGDHDQVYTQEAARDLKIHRFVQVL